MPDLRVIGLALFLVAGAAEAKVRFLNPVNTLPNGQGFEVVDRLGTDTARIWCDAARAAQAGGVGNTQRIYVSRTYGPSLTAPGIDGVSFTSTPDTAVQNAAQALTGARTLSLTTLGNNLTVGQGVGYCIFEIDG
ncbi:hypothetical protein [uncultured Shimia sp.]|uniref:hypothetical protein n=1 Tax=uncultured Shimia sp. TaxID=573152 RepID=UPI002609F035|nr:hypothetical protein [uncultured Shimia sp.]